jgi:hypothetical protein
MRVGSSASVLPTPDSIPAVTITNNVYSEVRLHRTRQHLRTHVSAGSNRILRSAQVGELAVPRREGRSGAVCSGSPPGHRFPTGRSQSRLRAISLSRWFAGTLYSSIAFLIAACSSGWSKTMPMNWAGVPRRRYIAQEWVGRLVGRLAIARIAIAHITSGCELG